MKTWLAAAWKRIRADLANMHKSLTIWFNSIIGTLAVALPALQDSLPQLQDSLPPNLYQYAMVALVLGNIVLRFKTNSALADK